MKQVAICLSIGILAPTILSALPAYSRIYAAKYGYRVSCSACHTNGGGSTITDYGRDFLRAGANSSAFAKVESRDSDKDGVTNLEEIKQKSNPGDERSTPAALGEWLNEAAKVSVPQKELKVLFTDAEAFAGLEGSLNPTQIEKVVKITGTVITDEDKVPTFYFAIKGGKKYAVAQYISVPTSKGPMSVVVGLDTRATVSAVKILKNPADKGVESSAFLKQFEGKRQSDLFEVGKNIVAAPGATDLSQAVATGVLKAIAIMNAVFGK